MPTAETNGILTHYEEEGAGPPVILIHGHAADRRMWERQSAFLTQQGFHAVRYDLRGHGCTDAPETGYSYADYTRDLLDLLDHLRIDRAHLVGLSMGSAVALTFALEHPQRVRSLALLSPSLPGYGYSSEFEGAVERLVDAVRAGDVREALETHWFTHPLFDSIRRLPEQFDFLRQMGFTYSGADYLDTAEYPQPEHQAVDRLDEIAAPALVMAGELDLPDFLLIADILAANLPNARKVVIPDAGHVLNLEGPEEVNDALLAFLKEVNPKA